LVGWALLRVGRYVNDSCWSEPLNFGESRLRMRGPGGHAPRGKSRRGAGRPTEPLMKFRPSRTELPEERRPGKRAGSAAGLSPTGRIIYSSLPPYPLKIVYLPARRRHLPRRACAFTFRCYFCDETRAIASAGRKYFGNPPDPSARGARAPRASAGVPRCRDDARLPLPSCSAPPPPPGN